MVKKLRTASIKGFLSHLADCVSRDETRYFMCHAHLERGTIIDPEASDHWTLIATDGRQCGVLQLPSDLLSSLYVGTPEPGYVDIDAKNMRIIPVKLDAQFPMWRKVIPSLDDTQRMLILPPSFGGSESATTLSRWLAVTGIVVNLDYLSSAPEGGTWTADAKCPAHKAIEGVYTGSGVKYHAVIMPMIGCDEIEDARIEQARSSLERTAAILAAKLSKEATK